ncbi:nitrate- and nitrite sensing domain-containing protein [Amycolatopsis sp. NBC_01307]|uniref:sensor histidine kinase n=1 Tax=Amycolatopsis sp. NBC_01307 TaxID=2903561 RepID=UPI002E0D96D4|nr:nitrate- and nitrite sensing domain-containing protein [Amycolatopsis sp. NBC_01307]
MPVGELLGRAPRRSKGKAVLQALVRWRDWSLPVKLSAVTVVPIVLAMVLGITTIAGQVGRSDDYQRLDRLVALGVQVRALTSALQQERTVTAAMLTDGTVGGTPELATARKATDAAVGPFTDAQARGSAIEPGVAGAAGAATAQVNNLDFLRRQVDGGQLDPGQAVTAYSGVTGALIGLDTAATAGAGDGTLGGTPAGLHELLVAGEQVSLSQAMVSYGINRGALSPSELATLRAAELRLADRLVDFRAAAGDALQRDFSAIAEGTDAQSRARMVESVLGAQPDTARAAFRALSATDWNIASTAMRAQIAQVADRLGTQASDTSSSMVEEASSGAGLLAVLLFAALVLAVAVVFLITRQLLRSLKVLRRSALDVAETALPEAVRNIQEGRAQGTDVTPVPIRTDDEVGEVARAFDKVHHQALRLATEQAAMRTGYGSVFVNLSRRSQSLVQRQLQLIEQLERDEEDADQLATLFQLDHLATRMRRNNENLMVLSGAEPGRRSGKPVGTTDMLRAAVSEIEQYQRVQVQPPPPARIVGYAASDLMRLVAELLDNATAFSAPETSVTVASRLGDDGSLNIDILDKGIGMNEAEVTEANTRLTEAGSVDLATSRRMGLFVVGRLASRHRIGVSLHGGKDIVGVRATVVVPAELVMPVTDGPLTGQIGTVQQSPLGSAGMLPRRQVNGSSRPQPVVPQQPPMGEERWPSASDLAGLANGHGPGAERPPTDLEISGTDLFAPIPKDDPAPPPRPTLPPVPAVLPVPQPPRHDDLPSGKDLFSANETTLSDWWRHATGKPSPAAKPAPAPAPAPALDRSETTPIFDEMLSAWFREDKPAEKPATEKPATEKPAAEKTATEKTATEKTAGKPVPAAATPVVDEESVADEEAAPEEEPAAEPEGRSWDFASDEEFRTVQAVTKAEPTAFTDAGLPRRRRGEQLMPGSATSSPAAFASPAPAGSDLPVRDPADVRGRLSSFQQGVTRGRQEAREAAAAQGAETGSEQQDSLSQADAQPDAQLSRQNGLPQPGENGLSPAAEQNGLSQAEQWSGQPAGLPQAGEDESYGSLEPDEQSPAESNGLPQQGQQWSGRSNGQPQSGQKNGLPQSGQQSNGQQQPNGLPQSGRQNGLSQPGQQPNGQQQSGQQNGPSQPGQQPNGLPQPNQVNGLRQPGQQPGQQQPGGQQPGQRQPGGQPDPQQPGQPSAARHSGEPQPAGQPSGFHQFGGPQPGQQAEQQQSDESQFPQSGGPQFPQPDGTQFPQSDGPQFPPSDGTQFLPSDGSQFPQSGGPEAGPYPGSRPSAPQRAAFQPPDGQPGDPSRPGAYQPGGQQAFRPPSAYQQPGDRQPRPSGPHQPGGPQAYRQPGSGQFSLPRQFGGQPPMPPQPGSGRPFQEQPPGAYRQPSAFPQPGQHPSRPGQQQPGQQQPGQQQPGQQQPSQQQPGQQQPGQQPGQRPDQQELPQQGGHPAFQDQPPPALPTRRPGSAPEPAELPDETPTPRREDAALEATAEWNFGSDEGWRTVQAVSQSAPATFTSAGLPRRRRGEQLLPGSAAPPTGAAAPRPQRDAHDVRGRLRSFQQGIERGRHRNARATETNHETLEGE